MSATTRMVSLFVTAAAVVFPAAAQAQATKESGVTSALTRAINLHDSAVALYNQPARAADAARIHLREVAYRTSSDPEAVIALVMASNLFNYANQPITARRTMVQAGDRALAMGDVVIAAQAFTNAAFLAQKSGNEKETQRLGRKAILLSHSPLLDAEQRATIRNRFRGSPAFAELLK